MSLNKQQVTKLEKSTFELLDLVDGLFDLRDQLQDKGENCIANQLEIMAGTIEGVCDDINTEFCDRTKTTN